MDNTSEVMDYLLLLNFSPVEPYELNFSRDTTQPDRMQTFYQLELRVTHTILRQFWAAWGANVGLEEVISPAMGGYDQQIAIDWGMQQIRITCDEWNSQDDVQNWWDTFLELIPNLDLDFMNWTEPYADRLYGLLVNSFIRISIVVHNQ
jgi:hypothetical protein